MEKWPPGHFYSVIPNISKKSEEEESKNPSRYPSLPPFLNLNFHDDRHVTIVEDLPSGMYPNRPWGPGNNPKTAVREFLKDHGEFQVDDDLEKKLLITVAPEGFLRRIRE